MEGHCSTGVGVRAGGAPERAEGWLAAAPRAPHTAELLQEDSTRAPSPFLAHLGLQKPRSPLTPGAASVYAIIGIYADNILV